MRRDDDLARSCGAAALRLCLIAGLLLALLVAGAVTLVRTDGDIR